MRRYVTNQKTVDLSNWLISRAFEDSAKSNIFPFLKQTPCKMEFSRIFKESVQLEQLTNLDAKGIKRSVNDWARHPCKVFFKNISFKVNSRSLKNNSLHTYGVRALHSLMCCEMYRVMLNTVSASG